MKPVNRPRWQFGDALTGIPGFLPLKDTENPDGYFLLIPYRTDQEKAHAAGIRTALNLYPAYKRLLGGVANCVKTAEEIMDKERSGEW